MVTQSPATADIREVLIEHLVPNPWQPRQSIDPGNLTGLANSIKTFGFSGHLEARPDPAFPNRLQLVFGHRRKEAARLAGLRTLTILVRDYTDKQMAELALLENTTQEEMSYFDQALAFQRMIDEYDYSIRGLAEMMGVAKGYIANRLEIARLPEGSPLREAARNGQTDMTTIQTLANLSRVMDGDQINELLEAAANKEITASQLKDIRSALAHGWGETITEEGHQIHTVTREDLDAIAARQREIARANSEERYRAFLQRDKAAISGGMLTDEPLPIRADAEASVLPKDTSQGVLRSDHQDTPEGVLPSHQKDSESEPDGWIPVTLSPLAEPTGRDWALRAMDQLKDNIFHLRRKMAQADFTQLEPEEHQQWTELCHEMNQLIA